MTETIKIYSPVDNSLVGSVPAMSQTDVDKAIALLKETFKSWKKTSIDDRARLLVKAADILEERAEGIARIMAMEISKDYKSCVSEVVRTADFIRYTAEEGKRLKGETLVGDSFDRGSRNKISIVTREPLGVVLAIAPFNYPVNLSASKLAPALIGGNVVLFKPPTQGAISALELVKALTDAGVPEGVIVTATGRGSVIGDYLVSHKGVDMVSFTGSTDVGQHIAKLTGMIPLVMELGGKDAAIILEDADIEKAAKNIVSGAFSYSGQRCTAVKRVLVMEEVADRLAASIEAEVKKLKSGLPMEEGVVVTPLIDKKAADFVDQMIDDAIAKGGIALTERRREGNLIYPMVFDHVTLDMDIAWEEPFGPVLPIIRVKSAEEAIEISNRSEYGLQGAIFTKDIDRAFSIAGRLEVGTVHINNKTQRGPDHFPFLGVKSSGMGTQGIRYSIESMTRPKATVITLNE